jgi:hypothetical protein
VAFGEREAGAQSIGTGVVDVQPGDYFELIARQTSGSTKNVATEYQVFGRVLRCHGARRQSARYALAARR